MIFKAALACQRLPSCPYKPLTFQTLRQTQLQSNFQSPKFKFSVSGKKNVNFFDIMTKTSVPSDKNVPLLYVIFGPFHLHIRCMVYLTLFYIGFLCPNF